MRFAVAASIAGLSAVAVASDGYKVGGYGPPPMNTTMTSSTTSMPAMPEMTPPTYTTEVVTELTTYCPQSTQITHGGVTYTVTEATTLTITNCPCTVTKPVYTTPSASPTPYAPPYPSGNMTSPVMSMPPTGTGAYVPPSTTSPIVPGYTGAASKASYGVLLAAAGLIAAL